MSPPPDDGDEGVSDAPRPPDGPETDGVAADESATNDAATDDAAASRGSTQSGDAASPEGADTDPEADGPRDGPQVGADGRRDVVVPMRLYKTVTVFSTLIAVVCVVLGFVLLDAATLQWSVLRRFVSGTLARLGADVPPDVLSAALAAVSLVVIAFGAGVYVLGTRFRARGMGKSQEDSPEGTNNG